MDHQHLEQAPQVELIGGLLVLLAGRAVPASQGAGAGAGAGAGTGALLLTRRHQLLVPPGCCELEALYQGDDLDTDG